ncbi:pentatricopeptide repeat-containing protein At5g08510 [Impatiens glandulifera]|uniref:pentatricopeptide repeat-containing protein At5g08510 n=1 Tax=Impatiens glandulifera TaxID=253017 RepID=UPI001FB12D23|nr:pentatricopeptide repeat-containing protein At5g08510 [Impatiens glandulifera]
MNKLKQVHAYTLRNGADFTQYLILELLKLGNIPYARKLFDLIPQPTLFLYNKFIQAYTAHGPYGHCIYLYNQMRLKDCSPNEYTFTFLFKACPSLPYPSHGQKLHGHFLKLGLEFDIHAMTALVDMYAKMGRLESAQCLFDEMPVRDVPTWNSLITAYARYGDMEKASKIFTSMPTRDVKSWTAMVSGYSQCGKYTQALDVFLEMENVINPTEVTIGSVLPACANLGAFETGQRIVEYARACGYFNNLFVCNSTLELYARCGKIQMAKHVFDEIGRRRDMCSWNVMLMGLAIHGQCYEALQLFQKMLREAIAPDDITFVGVLLACTHGGLVVKGRKIFSSMEKYYSITPKLEHYGCMADLLGRAGELHEAYYLIQTMPMKPDSVMWGALLGACSFFHGNVELAEIAAESLFKLEPNNPGNYVTLSNIYASAGKWDGVAKMRRLMKKGHQMSKAAGYSFFEEGGQIHMFNVQDRSHPRSLEIYSLLDQLVSKMKPRYGVDYIHEDAFMIEDVVY